MQGKRHSVKILKPLNFSLTQGFKKYIKVCPNNLCTNFS